MCLVALALFFAFRVPQGVVVGRGDACVKAQGGSFEVATDCTETVELKRRNDLITPTPGTKIDELDGGVRLQQGKATFAVWKRQGRDALQVRVSHGLIEVVGTRFTVEQTETDGSVHLEEGEIGFHWQDGHTTRLTAGESLSWGTKAFAEPKTVPPVLAPAPTTDAVPTPDPDAPAPAAEPTPVPTPPPAPVKSSKLSMDEVLLELATLRNQRKYKEAVTLLRPNTERSDFSMSQRARLSYEMGMLLQDRLRDRDTACKHWRWHAERFPENGERAQRVNQAIQTCETPAAAHAPSEESPTPSESPQPEAPQEEHD